MKKLFALALALSCIQFSFAQSPQKMSYQSVIRDASGELVVENPVGIQVSILYGLAGGTAAYVETHSATTNVNGLVSLEIGTGTVITGTFAGIDWRNGPYFVKTEIDASGGTSYSMSATSELLSVPYALHAKTADNVSGLIIQEPLEIAMDVEDLTSNFPSPDANEGGFVASFENTNTGNGDGIKIKLGKQRTDLVPPVPLTPAELEAAEQIRQLLDAATPLSQKENLLEGLILDGIQEDYETIAGIAVGAGNLIVEFINLGIGLPRNIAEPINAALDPFDFGEIINAGISLPLDLGLTINDGLDLPWDITGPINSLMGLPYDVCMPYIGCLEVVDRFPSLEIPGIPVNIDQSTDLKIPGIPSNVLKVPNIPDFEIPAIPQIPELQIGDVTITPIDPRDLEYWGIRNFVLTELNNEALKDENEFIRFSDVNDSKMGSIRAVNRVDWAQANLDLTFLRKVYGVVTKTSDKKHMKGTLIALMAEKAWDYGNMGVEYSSSFGDYAEWLERADPDERMRAGSIVGVVGGKISKDLTNAEQVMVVSHSPIVLGNVPEEGSTHLGNNIAFVGQVPVKVMGAVHTGDYIIGNPSTPGYGYAKDPAEMSIEEVNLAVGRSWEDSPGEGPKLVNTVVGVHNGDYMNILKNQAQRLETANDRLGSAESKVESLESNMESVLQMLSIEANSK